jgi:hypothetical protein
MIQSPGVVVSLVWTFATDVFPELFKKVAVELSIHRLSNWNNFLMHNAHNVKSLPHFPSLLWSKVV